MFSGTCMPQVGSIRTDIRTWLQAWKLNEHGENVIRL